MEMPRFFIKMRKRSVQRLVSVFLLLNLLVEIITPTAAMALTSGPAQPEFSSFEPVATTDMVNEFTGDFTYNLPVLNVPGPDGGGYSLSLSYHTGASSEEEASWVGFGWTLNPGAINRAKRGFADEFNGVDVINYNKVKPNWTGTAKFDLNMELNSKDQISSESGKGQAKSVIKIVEKLLCERPEGGTAGGDQVEEGGEPSVSLSLSHTVRYNNYSGFSIANGIGLGVKGIGSLSMNRSGNQNTYNYSINPGLIQMALSKNKMKDGKNNQALAAASPEKPVDAVQMNQLSRRMEALKDLKGLAKDRAKSRLKSSAYNMLHASVPSLAYSVAKHSASSWNFSGSAQFNPTPGNFGFQVGVAGSMNVQIMDPEHTTKAYGYLNSARTNTNTEEDRVFDFQIEKETTFSKHDNNMGIPFNSADVFNATGNGIVGGFRAHFDQIGSYYPNFSTTDTKIRQLGVEVAFGFMMEVGVDVGIGKNKTEVRGRWPKMPGSMASKIFSGSRPHMRFTNDPGGELNYSDDYESLLFATIKMDRQLDLGAGYNLSVDPSKRRGSSHIEYIQPSYNHTNTNPSITGVRITNKDGGKSNYELPVYTRNETELTIGVSDFKDGEYLVTQPLHFDNPLENTTVVGQRTEAPYAASYLLTSNTTFNYVDADGDNEPSTGDFGGWTKFGYRQAYGNSSQTGEWFRYRTPYSGLRYNHGRRLDPKDQTGSMSSGEKEVYYLKCIETKSHIAFFVTNTMAANTFTDNFPQADYPFLYEQNVPVNTVTLNASGSGTDRYDGVDAAAISGGMDPASGALTARGAHKQEKLEKIVLFSKSDLSVPLMTTFFDYDYSLCPGIPNSVAPAGSGSRDRGKLTLKKVWTESNGVVRSLIAPYQFHYEYFHQYPSEITSRYLWADTDFNMKYTSNDASQNPVYAPWNLDAWGNYQADGEARYARGQSWVSQRAPVPGSGFDPASWQLKRIQLPSGGEIHIHYEQKDYTSLQDHHPTAMVSLKEDIANKNGYKSDESVYAINYEDIDVSTSDLNAYRDLLFDYFVTQKNKLYFKVLYAFSGDDEPELNQDNRRFDYVTGYTVVNDVTVSGTSVLLSLGDSRNECLGGGPMADKTLPRYVCYQELLTNGGQNLGLNASAYKDENYLDRAYKSNPMDDALDISRNKVLINTVHMFGDWIKGDVRNVKKAKACKVLSCKESYFKVPVFHAKKGGGVRVKRLLTYDPGIASETGDAMLYGSEYIYKNEDGSSSGVAVNEPPGCREENAMVTLIERKRQRWIQKIKNGRDTKQFEGPLGENIMPSASVVHSRVVTKNIHTGRSSTGYKVSVYHTAKDYPMQVDFTPISKKDGTYKKFNLSIPMGIFSMNTSRAWVTQGYIFKQNDMNGKLASTAVYAGNYDPASFRESGFASKTQYEYSAPGEKISSIVYDPDNQEMTREFLNPGMEEDYTIFTSNVKEIVNDFNFELDFNLTLPIVPSLGFSGSFSYSDQLLCQHVTSKVVSQTSHLLSTTTIADGVTQTTRNIAFDKYTNEPVLTCTYDGYTPSQGALLQTEKGDHRGYYYSLDIPASWVYASMGPKTMNGSNTNQLTAKAAHVVTYSLNALKDMIDNPVGTSWSPLSDPLKNIVSATATSYTNNWFDAGMKTAYPSFTNAPVLAAVNDFYYPSRTYHYKDLVKSANETGGRIYEGGVVGNDFKFFDWKALNTSTVVPAEWYSESRVTRYSPFGYPVEEVDNLGIASSAQFGYQDQLPVVVARNAALHETRFTDFEYGFGSDPNVTFDHAHSGRASYNLSLNPNYQFATGYPLTPAILGTSQVSGRGLSIKLWLRSVKSTAPSSQYYGLKNTSPQLKAVIGGKNFDCRPIAQTGEWTLYSADIVDFKGLVPGIYNMKFQYSFSPNEEVRIDDLRIQPLDATMNCSVYYPDNKLAAQFDDQHFGVFYEYNNRGQLVRKSIETERGKKTLREQQYNLPLVEKN
jgi:hypothetical protein